jgi:hypothetical protein
MAAGIAKSDLVSTGIVEVERNGMIHHGQYRTDGAVVTVSYGSRIKRVPMRRRSDEPHVIARRLLREIIAEIHKPVSD